MGQLRLIALLELLAAARAVIHGGRTGPRRDQPSQPLDHAGEARRESHDVVRG